MEHLSQRVRANNVVMHGVPDTAAYSRPADLERFVKRELDSAMPSRAAAPVSKSITAVRHIGRPAAGTGPGRRAVIVEFASSEAKHVAFRLSTQLRLQGIHLSDELTKKQLQAQRGLEADFAALKAKGFQPFYRQGRLKYMDQGVLRTCKRGEATRVTPCAPGASMPRPSGPRAPRGPRPHSHQHRPRRATPATGGIGSPHPSAAAANAHTPDPVIAAANAAMAAAAAATAGSPLPPPRGGAPPPGGTADVPPTSTSPQ